MRLPKNVFTGTYTKPKIFLCETDKQKMGVLNTTDTHVSLKFNTYSELTFNIDRTYIDILTGQKSTHLFYDRIEHPRLILLDDIGYFQIQAPDMTSDNFRESKTITAYSSEYALSQKYITDLHINTGEVDSVEVIYSEEIGGTLEPVIFYNEANPRLSLLHLVLEGIYGWKIGHVADSLKTLVRSFDIDRQSVYDFLMNDVCEKYNCYIIFDTLKNEINIYAESMTAKFIGDGKVKTFTISPPFHKVNTVSIDGYKTTQWEYNKKTGVLTLNSAPKNGSHIEVVDGGLTEWETDVFVTYENLASEMNVTYNADDIKTQLTVTYGDDLDIREINMGSPYITDLSYYYTVDWMGQDLYNAYTTYLKKSQTSQTQYTKNSQAMLKNSDCQYFEEHRLSMAYSTVTVDSSTIGTYYVKDSSNGGYFFKEVTLPDDYKAYTTYYQFDGVKLTPEKVSDLYMAIRDNFKTGSVEKINELADAFEFMNDSDSYGIAYLSKNLNNSNAPEKKKTYVMYFLKEMWEQVGRTPLKSLYQETFKVLQSTNIDWAQEHIDPDGNKKYHENYPWYYAILLFLESIDIAITTRDQQIEKLQNAYDTLQESNIAISNGLLMENNFTEAQLIRLSAFIKEDELHIDDIIETEYDTLEDSFKVKQDAMESGRIELRKRCQPQLQFSMTMANIYAIPEFEPIIDQFQLGKVIKIGLRKDYIKQSRLLQVDMGLDDLSDFEVQFGELTSLSSQSDIHADLLSQAIQAGKSVASSQDNWNAGVDKAISTDLKIQQGLLDATTVLKSMDGTQGTEIDKYGIHLRKVNPDTGEVDPKQGWITNNMMAYTDNNWLSSKSVFGEYLIKGESSPRWGLLADACIASYIEGSTLIGGRIEIGKGENGAPNFSVDYDGNMIAQSADVVGKITADEGSIRGNLEISGALTHTNDNYTVQLRGVQEDLTNSVFHIAEKSGYTTKYPFRVNGDGSFVATKATITGNITTSNLQADGGKIGGFDITDKYIAKTKKAYGDTYSGVYIGTDGIGLGANKFYVTSAGKLLATDAEIKGKIETSNITATGGTIGGFDITSSYLSKTKKTYNDANDGVYIGTTGIGLGKGVFYVKSDGSMVANNITTNNIKATGGTIGGFTITSSYIAKTKKAYNDTSSGVYLGTDGIGLGANKFYVTSAGKLTATDAEIKGKIETTDITATGGTVGGFTITSSYLAKTKKSYSDANDGVYIGTTGIGLGKGVFYAKSDGSVVANNITTNGIKATGGTIGGWTLSAEDIAGYSNTTIDNSTYRALIRKSSIGRANSVVLGVGKKVDGAWTWPFYVDGVGKLRASGAVIEGTIKSKDADIEGKIVANSGTIGGCQIINGTLQIKNANIKNLEANSITANMINGVPVSKLTSGTCTANTTWTGGFYAGYGNGAIGGCPIVNGHLEVDSAHIKSLDANKLNTNNINGHICSWQYFEPLTRITIREYTTVIDGVEVLTGVSHTSYARSIFLLASIASVES